MSKSKFNPLITASVMSAVYLAGISSVSLAADIQAGVQGNLKSFTEVQSENNDGQSTLPAANAAGQRRYIVQFKEEPVARYNGTGQYMAIPRLADNKIQVNSPAVQAYVSHLKQQQANFLNSVSSTLNRTVKQNFSYQFAINGLVLELTAAEASQIASNPAVKNISADREYELTTDAGPQLIGANNVWSGTAPSSGTAFGEGVVVGILDSGTNFDHPSLADVGADSYDHTNPLGSGNYLGVCDSSNPDQFLATYTCNDKIIGGYDFVNAITPVGGTDIPGPEDEGGHGTHTSTTAVGNLVTGASVAGINAVADISGVARHANLVIFDTCYTPAPGAVGGCFGSSAVASIDQIIADGIVDVVNYSISGGNSPWTDTVSLAFLSATDSGVFVSASGGNSGPTSETPAPVSHVEPWTSTVAASTHTRAIDSPGISITGPVIDPALVGIPYNTSNGPAALTDTVAGINYAGVIDPLNVTGCVPFPAASFAGVVALISRGGCAFGDKVVNAQDAGAVAAIIHNNVPDALNMDVGLLTTIPSFSIDQADGIALADYLTNNAAATVLIEMPFFAPTQADVVAGFSSRGPSPFEYNKPDVSAPGVEILAGWADSDTATGTASEFNIISGTSMSSPHNAGAAALIKELHPNWTAPEIKSALMLTAVTAGVTKEDGITAADPYDRGAGRIQVDVASSTGLVMNETSFKFLLADPADGGDPKTLNTASYKNNNCVGTCSFQRKFRSVAAVPVNYSASLSGMTGTVSPATFTAMPGQTVTLNVDIDGGALTAGATSFGELMISEDVGTGTVTPFVATPAVTAIPDDGYDGTLGSMLCESINVTGISSPVFSASLDMSLNHTWTGDVTVKLQNPNGDVLGVMSRPDLVEPADDGTACCGTGEALVDTSPVTFMDGAATSAENMGVAGGDICAIDGICEYAPSPGSVVNPPATFADLGVGSANGAWNICVGDSGLGDLGTLTSVTLNIIETVANTVPNLHMPLVVVGFPEAAEIDVTPASLSATLNAGTTIDLNLNVSNDVNAGLPLNWIIDTTSTSNITDQVLYEQLADGLGNGIVSDVFVDGVTDPGAYSADSFVLAEETDIDGFFFDGFISNGDLSLSDEIESYTVTVYADNAGVPAGNPEDGGGTELFTVTVPVGDYSLDLSDDTGPLSVNLKNATGSSLTLAAGTYWVTGYANFTGANRWNWLAGIAGDAILPHLIDPQDLFGVGFTDWTDINTVTAGTDFPGMAFNFKTLLSCGAPWITYSTLSGTNASGTDTDVTVTLDATGLTPGVYEGSVCVTSDDPDEPTIAVPVTMTVDGLSDLIFENGFE